MKSEKTKENQIGSKIKSCREKLGMTQTELAVAIDYHRNSITRWESGSHPVSKAAARQLSKVLGVNLISDPYEKTGEKGLGLSDRKQVFFPLSQVEYEYLEYIRIYYGIYAEAYLSALLKKEMEKFLADEPGGDLEIKWRKWQETNRSRLLGMDSKDSD